MYTYIDMCTKLKIQPIDKNLIILLTCIYVPFLLVYDIYNNNANINI